MKKFFQALILLTFLAQNDVAAQVSLLTNAHQNPLSLEEWKAYETPNDNYVLTKIYPVGWSQAGNFAYLEEIPDEGCSCYRVKLAVIDARLGIKVWEYNYSEERDPQYSDEESREFQGFIKQNGNKLSQRLARFKIQSRGGSAKPFPLVTGDDRLGFSLSKTDDSTSVKEVVVELLSDNLGSKTILKKTYNVENVRELREGVYFKSPYLDLVVVAMPKIVQGRDGEPMKVAYDMIGADLKNGYRFSR